MIIFHGLWKRTKEFFQDDENKTQQSNLLVIHAFKAYFSKTVNHHLISGDYHCPHFIIVKILYVACFVRILGEVFCHHFATKNSCPILFYTAKVILWMMMMREMIISTTSKVKVLSHLSQFCLPASSIIV